MDAKAGRITVGTAGWSVPSAVADQFGAGGSALERYATRFSGVEINSTFYRPHQAKTFERWAAITPADFRFALKAPKTVTHVARLEGGQAEVGAFLDQTSPLGPKRGPILFQLPPSLAFDGGVAEAFLDGVRRQYGGLAAFEPRHASWFTEAAEALLARFEIARVAADPPRAPSDEAPGGWPALAYWRMHGSPRIYFSPYDDVRLDALTKAIEASTAQDIWCVFDNTASSAAGADALRLSSRLNLAAPRMLSSHG